MMQVKRMWLVFLSCMLVTASFTTMAAAAEGTQANSNAAATIVLEDFEDMAANCILIPE